jgi:hypothetical protein
VKPSDSRLLTSSVVDCRVVLAFGSHDDHGINANANAVTVDHRTVMIDHRITRGAVTATVMRQMRTLTCEETRVVRSNDECDDGIVDLIPSEPPDISPTAVCLLRVIRINSGEKLKQIRASLLDSTRLDSRLARSADDVFKCDHAGIVDSIPSEPPELSSSVSALVCRDNSWGAVPTCSSSPRVSKQAGTLVWSCHRSVGGFYVRFVGE